MTLKRILLLLTCMLCLHIPSITAKIDFKCTVSVTAYKIIIPVTDQATRIQTWSLQTKDSSNTIMSSSIVRESIANILLSKNGPTYVFVYKNPRAAGTPIRSVITPEAIRAAGSDPVMVINHDGTVAIAARKTYENIRNKFGKLQA